MLIQCRLRGSVAFADGDLGLKLRGSTFFNILLYGPPCPSRARVYDVVPSEGVLLCSMVGAPIIFESGMKGVERQPPGQRPVEEGGQQVM